MARFPGVSGEGCAMGWDTRCQRSGHGVRGGGRLAAQGVHQDVPEFPAGVRGGFLGAVEPGGDEMGDDVDAAGQVVGAPVHEVGNTLHGAVLEGAADCVGAFLVGEGGSGGGEEERCAHGQQYGRRLVGGGWGHADTVEA